MPIFNSAGPGYEDDPYSADPYAPNGPGTTAPPPAESVPPPAAGGAPAGGGGGGGAAGFTPSGLPNFNFLPVPKFDAPEFVQPDADAVLNSPGYQFRLNQGQQGIERSAAARGLLRTGGTLKDIGEYNQNFASNEYSNEFNRALQTFATNYQGLKDEYAPLYGEWQMLSNAELQRVLAGYNRDTVWHNPNGGGGGGGSSPIVFPQPNPNDY